MAGFITLLNFVFQYAFNYMFTAITHPKNTTARNKVRT